ncbi:unnamed protein product [Pedinophyceae sp. YPF-701]|nr:unnamed protein product [Pedinophyceae sp. YPF-701]
MGARKDLARLQAELDRICAGNGDTTLGTRRVAQEARSPDLDCWFPGARTSAFEAELAALGARKALHSDMSVDHGGSDVPPTEVDAQESDASAHDDASGPAAGADAAGAARGGHAVIDLTLDDSDGDGDGSAPAKDDDNAPAPPVQRLLPLGASRAATPAHRRRAVRPAEPVLWPAFVPAALRSEEALQLRMPCMDFGSHAAVHAKISLTAFYSTSADATLALLASGRLRRGGDAGAQRFPDVALHAMQNLAVLQGDDGANARMIRQATCAANNVAWRMEVSIRQAARSFTVATTSGTPLTAFARRDACGKPQSRLRPSAGLEQLVTFERLVLSEDGRTLRLGPGSLLRCLATGLIMRLGRRDLLLLLPAQTELRVTPGLLAGLLVEAEDMCTPPGAESALDPHGRNRVLRLRHMFDTYVRPLTQLPDGGGVLLPQAQVESWLPGAAWLPAVFRAPLDDLPRCVQLPPRAGRLQPCLEPSSPPRESAERERGGACGGGDEQASGDGVYSRQTALRACRVPEYVEDSDDEPSPATSASWQSELIASPGRATNEEEGGGGGGAGGAELNLCSGAAEARGHGRPRNTGGAVSSISIPDRPESAAKLFALTFNVTRADTLLALVGSGELPGLKSEYKDGGRVSSNGRCALDACLRAVRDVTEVSHGASASDALSTIEVVFQAVENLQSCAIHRMRRAAMRLHVREAHRGCSDSALSSCRAFRRVGAERSRLYPAEDAGHLATFEQLVLRPDGGLRFGEGSLLRCLATACVQGLPVAQLTCGDEGDLRLTPALLAGVLVEAEDMCTPVCDKRAFRAPFVRLARMRELFDAHEDITLCSASTHFKKVNDERRKRKRDCEDDGSLG